MVVSRENAAEEIEEEEGDLSPEERSEEEIEPEPDMREFKQTSQKLEGVYKLLMV